MDKLKMHSPDMTQENIKKIQALFPNCVTEARDKNGKLRLAIDFDQLKQELSDSIVEGPQERYHLNWPGKREALLAANAPIAKTLRPCREESLNFDSTENLFIEGDNFDALKLLQECYLGQIKMIYIDPPYNTGKDFIYADDYAENSDVYMKSSNQKSEMGERLIINSENNGRFHSDWLSMMYSRLKLARNLLKDDGLVFISIDEVEVANLRKISDEIFGANNFITDFIWQNKKGGGNDAKYCAIEHEYILLYAKDINSLPRLFESFSEKYAKRYKEEDEKGRYFWDTFKRKSGKQYYPITCPDGTVLEYDEYGNPLSWLRSEARFKNDVKQGEIKFEKRADGWSVMFKQRMPEGKKPRSLLLDKGTTGDGSAEILALFEKNVFSNPKPSSLLSYLIGIGLNDNDIILDFFAGSATTAHAVMDLNAKDGLNRKFILVQLPEKCDDRSDAYKLGYGTIADISKERIRRAGLKILEGDFHKDWKKDIGFRVLKVDTSNMSDVFYSPNQTSQSDLDLLVDHIKTDRTDEDLLFQVLLDSAVVLTLPITLKEVCGKPVYFVDENALVACFAQGINEDLVKELASFQPLQVVFRDDAFESNAMKINAEQIFKQLSPNTVVKAI